MRRLWTALKGVAYRIGRVQTWLIPMVSVLLVFGLLLLFAQSSPLAPFIYTLF